MGEILWELTEVHIYCLSMAIHLDIDLEAIIESILAEDE